MVQTFRSLTIFVTHTLNSQPYRPDHIISKHNRSATLHCMSLRIHPVRESDTEESSSGPFPLGQGLLLERRAGLDWRYSSALVLTSRSAVGSLRSRHHTQPGVETHCRARKEWAGVKKTRKRNEKKERKRKTKNETTHREGFRLHACVCVFKRIWPPSQT